MSARWEPPANASEHQEQMDFVRWFRQTYRDKFIHATPNAGKRSPRTAAKLKAEGMVTGFPDLSVDPDPLHIEFKKQSERNHKDGGCSKAQLACHARLRAAGCTVLVAYGSKDAQEQVKAYYADQACHVAQVNSAAQAHASSSTEG